MTDTRPKLTDVLARANACGEAMAWVRERIAAGDDVPAMWDACPRGDWLLWLAGKAKIDRRLLVLAACDCARLVLHLVPAGEDRPRMAIETAERWARGEATIAEVYAVNAAAASASAAVASAAAAAYAAADASDAASAATYAAYAAAYAATYAATNAAATDAATYAATRARMHRQCADAARARIDRHEVEKGLLR